MSGTAYCACAILPGKNPLQYSEAEVRELFPKDATLISAGNQ